MSASYFPVAASFFAASGNSNAPGTCTTSTSLLPAPARSNTSTAAARSRSVIKLLNRLTTTPKRKPAALKPPSIFPGCILSAIANPRRAPFRSFTSFASLLPLFPLELWRPLLQKCFRTFTHIFRRARHAKKCRLQEQSFFLGHFHAPLNRLHREFHGNGPVGDNLLRHPFGGGNEFRWFVNVIDQPDAQCFLRRNHLTSKAEFMRDALAAQPRQPLRSTIAGKNPEFHFRLSEFCRFAGDSNGAGKRKLASSAQRKSIDRADRRLPHRFQQMENALTEKRKFPAVDRRLNRQFADVRARHERFLTRAGQEQHPHGVIAARVQQRVLQLFD